MDAAGGRSVRLADAAEGIDGAELLTRAVSEAEVAFVPGRAFHPDGSGANTIRLSYSLPTPGGDRRRVRRLAGLL